MEDLNRLKERFKMIVKEEIKKPTKISMDKHWDEMNIIIDKAVEFAKKTIAENEIFIDNVVKEARTGASYVAVNQMVEKVAAEAVTAAKPLIDTFSGLLVLVVTAATTEAIQEVIQEEIARKMKQFEGSK